MVGQDVYAIGTSDESNSWTVIAELEKSMDKEDFLSRGYFVDEEIHRKKLDGSVTPKRSKRRQGRNKKLDPRRI